VHHWIGLQAARRGLRPRSGRTGGSATPTSFAGRAITGASTPSETNAQSGPQIQALQAVNATNIQSGPVSGGRSRLRVDHHSFRFVCRGKKSSALGSAWEATSGNSEDNGRAGIPQVQPVECPSLSRDIPAQPGCLHVSKGVTGRWQRAGPQRARGRVFVGARASNHRVPGTLASQGLVCAEIKKYARAHAHACARARLRQG